MAEIFLVTLDIPMEEPMNEKIIYFDDQKTSLEALAMFLECKGFVVDKRLTFSMTPAQAWDIVHNEKPDAVIIDVNWDVSDLGNQHGLILGRMLGKKPPALIISSIDYSEAASAWSLKFSRKDPKDILTALQEILSQN